MASFLDNLHRVFTGLNGSNVRYLLVGGLAVAAHGYTRATNDIDLVVALDRENALRAVDALTGLGYRPVAPVPAAQFAEPNIRRQWIKDKGMLVFQMRTDNPLDAPVDLFVTEPFDFDRAYAAALPAELIPGLAVPVVPLEILLAMKKEAGRPKDEEDLRILRELHSENPDKV